MKATSKHIVIFILLCISYTGLGQNSELKKKSSAIFTVRGSVYHKYSNDPINLVNIEVNGGAYAVTGSDGSFRIKVKIGDELVVRHKDFETVYYTIESDERVVIEVEPEQPKPSRKERLKQSIQTFNKLIDSANFYLKTDAEQSIHFIADALNESTSQDQNAEAYKTLGDLYMHWKQFDLAISNYRISLQNSKINETQLKLAKAYKNNKNYQESLEIYSNFNIEDLSNFQEIEYYENFGDTYIGTKDYKSAISIYEKGLKVAKDYKINSKTTDLNSKIAQAYNLDGNIIKAKGFFNSSLSLAEKENKKRALEEKITVAEFNNTAKNYTDEISLRKQAVEDIKEIESDSFISNESNITPQKQNYKIGNAYYLQKDYDSAIPYLEKSIQEADSRADLIIKNNALRRIADVYENKGDFDKAKQKFQEYIASVDELYTKKEQEIYQAARSQRNIIETQNRITSLENDRKFNQIRYDLTNRNQQIIIYSLSGGLLLLLIGSYFAYKYIKQQRLANNLLALKSLRSQMNPHFIFNALNSVNSFIATNDERTANRYLSDFSFLMRAVLENSEEDFIPLQKEIDLLELYVKLEHFRFQDKFDYAIEVEKTVDVEKFKIPPMLLQPYIENAVWHGLRYKTEKGLLKILIASRSKDEIIISIIDDGVGRVRSKTLKTDNQKKHNSKGLSNIKKRVAILNDMYKDKVDVSIEDYQNSEDTGTKVVVTLKKD
ncbi:tetratricopeptide repeat-containing sensor histidine kinase [Winogradskyella immobilis]|uniref:tetratricopeptide repeat-containing sensor histidine kinase n=1 Tax=Winogradskyella immobilis TaxID=2816852 RepID=UPI001D0C75DF|nr:histidine kinase [Winogradskyella immobilis]MCG0015127.1 histidine kinase [Winogradskyella immobilis]